ncbi:gliding motility-associated C-terminal domain-containing protein [Pontibacter diazotrophicus]|uniref:Gliding motility-associated C-terminal domain-containing protein n=1 Tax=Pontibacter diazotrophicus TaxID=1400979 RepID=A0A3D8L4T9_9BACT|nr:gliding motility-associated C-terminal domain-containing protein [Pontibacter diazotrophicus]RDV11942.1 gliding motility-associated C-terminal domain-containing protein [Pontibacter diazotrophicus]
MQVLTLPSSQERESARCAFFNPLLKVLLVCFLLLSYFPADSRELPAQAYFSANTGTALRPGDVAVSGFNAGNGDIGFVAWVDMAPGTEIRFTNNGWRSAGATTAPGNARNKEQVATWTNTTGSTIAAGTTIALKTASPYTTSLGSTTVFSNSGKSNPSLEIGCGDQITVYQTDGNGTGFTPANSETATFTGTALLIVHWPFTWTTSGKIGDATTYLPSDLADYSMTFGMFIDPLEQYVGPRAGKTTAEYAALLKDGSNWSVLWETEINPEPFVMRVDFTPPLVEGIADNGVYNSDITISFNEGTATLNGEPFASGSNVGAEGDYALTVSDAAENTTTVRFRLDKAAPTGSIAINGGAAYTNSASVALAISAADGTGSGVTGMRFSNDNSTWSAWETAGATKNWTLASGDGSKTVYAELRDEAGNVRAVRNAIVYDATAPAGYGVVFNTGPVDIRNVGNVSMGISGAETGATLHYTITSSQGGTPVTGTAPVESARFDISSLDLTGLHDGTLSAAVYLQDAAGNKGAVVTAEVVKITRDIADVTAPATIRVPIRTACADVPLPATVEVAYATGIREQVRVAWGQDGYNGFVAGAYELSGVLVPAPMTTNLTGITARITVEVQSNKVPTALALSTATFTPEATADNALGVLTTTDPDDSQFVYALVGGEGSADNSLFEISGDKLHLKSNQGMSGRVQFSIRVRSTDTYHNAIEKSFRLDKELYAKPENQLKIVNAFSPDGDGINDTWVIPELRFYNNVEVEVFSRAGARLFRTTNPEQGWDGMDRNGKVLEGGFLYIVQIRDINVVKKGVVTVLKK